MWSRECIKCMQQCAAAVAQIIDAIGAQHQVSGSGHIERVVRSPA